MDNGVAGKLWDGATWSRPVMDKSRAFDVETPWYGILAGGHIPEVFKATLQATLVFVRAVTLSCCSWHCATVKILLCLLLSFARRILLDSASA
jgi:hypothetical protein